MSKLVGYLEGSDSLWLTKLQLLGHDTLPLSNGFDGHGLNIEQLNQQHKIGVVIGYVHKLIPPRHLSITVGEVLHATKVYEIPVLIACPQADFAVARQRLGELPPNAQLVDPADIVERASTLLA